MRGKEGEEVKKELDRGRRGKDMVMEMKVKRKIEKRNGNRVQRKGRKAYRES